jgi:tRNA modification GTPase
MTTWQWTTPPDPAAVALVLVPALPALLDRALPAVGRARFAHLVDSEGAPVDEVVATRLDADRLELGVHGGLGQRRRVEAALLSHALQADPVTGESDLWQRLGSCLHPAALPILARGDSHPFADRRPRLLITGPANAGKSTLLNAWSGQQRALVSDQAGTTRDLVTAPILINGWRCDLSDSAGLRRTADALEAAGQALVAQARASADLVLHLWPVDAGPAPRPAAGELLVHGKADLAADWPDGLAWAGPEQVGDARSNELISALGQAICTALALPAEFVP